MLVLTVAFAGCPRPSGSGPETGEGEEAFVLGDLIEPFDPPSLAELEAKVKWVDMPVLDSIQLLRERQAGEKPLATVEEALALRNTSPENNEKILSALGRLPENDAQADRDAEIVRWTPADVKSTNGLLASSTVEFDVNGLTSFGLFSFDWDFRPFASSDAVVSWQSSGDKMYDKVVIRDDMTWSDGKPITAHDLVFSYKVIMSSAVPVPAMRSGTDKLRWIEAYDDHTLVYFHKEALATNVWNLNFSVIPKHIYENSIREDPTLQDSDYHVKYENQPVSGGSYIISKRVRDQEIVLTRRESYYMHQGKQVRDKPFFKTIRFRIMVEPSVALIALKAGDIEEMEVTPAQWRTQTDGDDFYKNNTKAYGVQWLYYYFGWNIKTPFFSDKRVRQAMSYAFDHKELIQTLEYGLVEPSTGIFHQTSVWYPKNPPQPYLQNLEKAKQLLDEAGWTDHDGDGYRDKEIDGKLVEFEFTMLVMNRPDRIDVCNLLKENLARIGVVCNVRPLEFTVLQQKTRDHEFQAHFGGWGTGADPDTSENLWGTGQDRNFVQYSNPEVDRLFAEGRKEFDEAKRAEIYGKIHNILFEDQPYTWLYVRNSFYGFNRSLRGYVFSPRGPYNYGPGFGSIWKPAAP
jgi:peptide/nickel transport system substrate-binding protein